MKIRTKLIGMFFITGILPLMIIGWWSFYQAKNSLMAKSYEQLESVREIKKTQILGSFKELEEDMGSLVETTEMFRESAFRQLASFQDSKANQVNLFFQHLFDGIKILSQGNRLLKVYSAMKQYHDDMGFTSRGAYDVLTSEYQDLWDEHSSHPINYLKTYGYDDLYLMCAVHGHVMFSVEKSKDLGTNLVHGPYKEDALTRIWQRVTRTQDIAIEDFSIHTAGDSRQVLFAGAPVYDETKQLVGIVALKILPDSINAIVQDRKGLGNTGEAYLVGKKDGSITYRSDRVIKEGKIGDSKETYYAKKALSGQSGQIVATGSTGGLEVINYDPLEINGLNWAVITNESLEENIVPKNEGEDKDYFTNYAERHSYYDLFLIHPEGRVFYSVTREADYGTNMVNGKYADSGLGKLVRRVLETKKFGMSDFEPYEPSDGEPAAFAAAPIIHNGEIQFIIAVQIPIEDINAAMQERSGMGKTGETYLIGADKRMRSDSFLDPQGHSIKASFAGTVEKNGVNTVAADEVLSGKTGSKIVIDYNGNPVLSAFAPLEINGIKWGILAEIDESEILEPINHLLTSILIAVLIIAIIGVCIAFFITIGITNPIARAVSIAQTMAKGDMTQRLSIDSQNEIGQLAQSLNFMTESLDNNFREVLTVADQIADAADQLSGASESLSQGASEQASSLEEISSTMVEIDAQTKSNSDHAANVNQRINELKEKAEAGSNEMANMTAAMKEIEEAGKSIGKIINVIDDIASQTNLLALNATIEAASAGDAGRGFAVVANEIKELANQSARAAKETAELIDGTNKKVGTGSEIAVQTADALNLIAKGSVEGATMTGEIAASTREQSESIVQVTGALEQVNQVTQMNTANSEETASSAEELAGQSEQLRQILSRFKLSEGNIQVVDRNKRNRKSSLTATVKPGHHATTGTSEFSQDIKRLKTKKGLSIMTKTLNNIEFKGYN